MKTHFVAQSGNRKLGRTAATYRTPDTCPSSCPFSEAHGTGGCYARFGNGGNSPFALAERRGVEDPHEIVDRIIHETLKGSVLRWEVSGDVVLADGVTPDRDYIEATARVTSERPDLAQIRFTHHWRDLSPDDFTFPANASTEDLGALEEALERGWQAVITVPRGDPLLEGRTFVGGKRVIRCPAEVREEVTCSTCRLCAKERGCVIAFASHGPGRKKIEQAIAAIKETE